MHASTLKGIDLTRNGLAVPLVEESHSAPLDLWAANMPTIRSN